MLTANFNNHNCFAQSGQKFATGLNSLSGIDALGSSNSFPLIIKTNNTEWMRITPAGNVGIGITAPTDKLHVSGTARMLNAAVDNLMQALSVSAQSADFATAVVTGQITAGSLTVSGNAIINGTLNAQTILQNGNPINQSQWTTSATSIFYSNGNVGIGTNNPTEMLTVEGRVRISGLPTPIDTTAPPPAQQRSLIFDGGTDEITATSGTLTFPNTNLVTSGSISSSVLNSTSITTQQLTINGGMLESDTMHARKTFSVNNSLKLERQSANNFAEVSTIDTSVALVLQRDTTGRGVGIGTTPSAGERLTVQGDVGLSGNLRLSNLSGTGDRVLYVDQNGNLKLNNSSSCVLLDPFWKTDGNNIPAGCDPFIGTTNAADLIFKTDNQERMRITSTGTHPGNVGIGTSTPEKKLHVVTTHTTCASCPALTHEGIRLEEQTTFSDFSYSTTTSVWDLQPYASPTGTAFAIKRPNEDPKMFITGDGNVGIGTIIPRESFQIGNIFTFHDGVTKTIGRNLFYDAAAQTRSIVAEPTVALALDANGDFSVNASLSVSGPAPISLTTNFIVKNDGNVGVGTTSPYEKFQIGNIFTFHDGGTTRMGRNVFYDTQDQRDERIIGGTSSFASAISFDSSGSIIFSTAPIGPTNGAITWTDAIIIGNDGNVGIGIPSALARLDIKGDTGTNTLLRLADGGGNDKFTVSSNGNVYIPDRVTIGTDSITSGPHTDYRLSVDGKIVSRSAYVTMSGWGDFVFGKDHRRMSFEEQLKYYPEYKRLFGMQSAEQIEKEGLNTGETLKALTINEEETKLDVLDLYMEVQSLKKEITVLKEEITDIKKKK